MRQKHIRWLMLHVGLLKLPKFLVDIYSTSKIDVFG